MNASHRVPANKHIPAHFKAYLVETLIGIRIDLGMEQAHRDEHEGTDDELVAKYNTVWQQAVKEAHMDSLYNRGIVW